MLENELRRHGITQKNTRPGHPTTSGKVERFQQTMKNWLRAQPQQPATLTELQQLIDRFAEEYNPPRLLDHHVRHEQAVTRNPAGQRFSSRPNHAWVTGDAPPAPRLRPHRRTQMTTIARPTNREIAEEARARRAAVQTGTVTVPVTLPTMIWGRLASQADARESTSAEILAPLIFNDVLPTDPVVPLDPHTAGLILEHTLGGSTPRQTAEATQQTLRDVHRTLDALGFYRTISDDYRDRRK